MEKQDWFVVEVKRDAVAQFDDEGYPSVPQIIRSDVLRFVFDRHHEYHHQKTQTDHWDRTDKSLKKTATARGMTPPLFVDWATEAMGLRRERK